MTDYTGDVPQVLRRDLRRMRNVERRRIAHIWANALIGGALFLICAGMLAYAVSLYG